MKQGVSKMPFLTADNKLNARARHVFTGIFERYAIVDPDQPEGGEKILMKPEI